MRSIRSIGSEANRGDTLQGECRTLGGGDDDLKHVFTDGKRTTSRMPVQMHIRTRKENIEHSAQMMQTRHHLSLLEAENRELHEQLDSASKSILAIPEHLIRMIETMAHIQNELKMEISLLEKDMLSGHIFTFNDGRMTTSRINQAKVFFL
jgi:hypothetical protein